MRVFGNELHYMSFSSLEDLMSSQFNALEMLINLAENNDYTYTYGPTLSYMHIQCKLLGTLI